MLSTARLNVVPLFIGTVFSVVFYGQQPKAISGIILRG